VGRKLQEGEVRVLCAWCGKLINVDTYVVVGQAGVRPDGPVSHGICGPCRDRMLEEANRLKEYALTPLIINQESAIAESE